MKLNLIKCLISICVSILIAYGFYTFHVGDNKEILAIGSLITLSISLLFSIAVSFQLQRTSTLIRTVSFIFFTIFFISNLIFNFINFRQEAYIICNGILILTYLLILYSISKAKQ